MYWASLPMHRRHVLSCNLLLIPLSFQSPAFIQTNPFLSFMGTILRHHKGFLYVVVLPNLDRQVMMVTTATKVDMGSLNHSIQCAKTRANLQVCIIHAYPSLTKNGMNWQIVVKLPSIRFHENQLSVYVLVHEPTGRQIWRLTDVPLQLLAVNAPKWTEYFTLHSIVLETKFTWLHCYFKL